MGYLRSFVCDDGLLFIVKIRVTGLYENVEDQWCAG